MTETKICTVCGNEYERDRRIGRAQWENSKYCGRACYWIGKRSKSEDKACEVCGQIMTRRGGMYSDKTWGRKRFCSLSCSTISKNRKRAIPVKDKFWRNVEVDADGECWEWTGPKTSNGYGAMSEAGGSKETRRTVSAHRVAYELMKGPIPEGAVVRHLCHNKACCNPAHLETGTALDNAWDSIKDGRHTKGEMHGQARLTEEKVRLLRAMPETTNWSALAREWGVAVSTVNDARVGKNWKHVKQ